MQRTLIIPLLALLVGVGLTGCASQEAYDSYRQTMAQIATDYYSVAGEPLLDLTLPAPDGGEYHLVINREVQPLVIGQIKDSEWTAPVAAAVGVAGGVATGWIGNHYRSKDIEHITGMAGGGTQITATDSGQVHLTNALNPTTTSIGESEGVTATVSQDYCPECAVAEEEGGAYGGGLSTEESYFAP